MNRTNIRYRTINSLEKLEQLLEVKYDIPNRKQFEQFIFQHPLRFTPYLLAQIKRSPAVARQYIPDPRELEPAGLERTFTGVMKTGIPGLERMYLDRVILMPTSQCFAYCRFCFRKNYSHDARDEDYGSPQDNFEKALVYIRSDERIKEVLITGGDPLMFPDKVLDLCRTLKAIPQLTGIRIGTRLFTSDPEIVTSDWVEPFKLMNSDNGFAARNGKRLTYDGRKPKSELRYEHRNRTTHVAISAPISISPHINHPDELSEQTIKALLLCTQNNVPLYNQTVLLRNINDDPDILIDLNRKLRQLGVEPYRIYQADPLQGANYLRTTLERTKQIKQQMRAKASGRIVPSFVIDTQIGKVDLADMEIVERNGTKLWIKTPYTLEIFRSMDKQWEMPRYCSLAKDGTLIVEYLDSLSFPEGTER